MKHITCILLFAIFLAFSGYNGFSDNDPTAKLAPQDRLNRSVDIIRQATGETELIQLLGDLVKFAYLIQDATDSILRMMDDCRKSAPNSTPK